MRFLLTCLFAAACCSFSFAQEAVREIDLNGATAVHIYAAFSSVKVVTGSNNSLRVQHELSLDGEQPTDLQNIEVTRNGPVLTIRELKPTAELLRRQAAPLPGQQNYLNPAAGTNSMINGVKTDALLKVTVPPGITVSVETEYGAIRAVNCSGLVAARAKYGAVDVVFTEGIPVPALELYSNYGAVDVTIPAGRDLSLELTTRYGELLTEPDIATDAAASEERDYYQHLVGKLGRGGKTLSCEAPYGNVYLREGSK